MTTVATPLGPNGELIRILTPTFADVARPDPAYLTDPTKWIAFGYGYTWPQPAGVPVAGGMSFTPDPSPAQAADHWAFYGVEVGGLTVGKEYLVAVTASGTNPHSVWRATVGYVVSSITEPVTTTPKTIAFRFTAHAPLWHIGPEIRPPTVGDWQNFGTITVHEVVVRETRTGAVADVIDPRACFGGQVVTVIAGFVQQGGKIDRTYMRPTEFENVRVTATNGNAATSFSSVQDVQIRGRLRWRDSGTTGSEVLGDEVEAQVTGGANVTVKVQHVNDADFVITIPSSVMAVGTNRNFTVTVRHVPKDSSTTWKAPDVRLTFSANIPAPPPVIPPVPAQVGLSYASHVTHSARGDRPSAYAYYGMYGSTWGNMWSEIRLAGGPTASRVTGGTLTITSSHTFLNSGADVRIEFGGGQAVQIHVPKSGGVTIGLNAPQAQALASTMTVTVRPLSGAQAHYGYFTAASISVVLTQA